MQRIEIDRNDIIVLSTELMLTGKQVMQLRRNLRRQIKLKNKIIILSAGLKLSTVRNGK